MSYTIFHRWSVAGKGRYRACTYNLPPVVGGVYNLPPVVGGVEAEVVGFGRSPRAGRGPRNFGGRKNLRIWRDFEGSSQVWKIWGVLGIPAGPAMPPSTHTGRDRLILSASLYGTEICA